MAQSLLAVLLLPLASFVIIGAFGGRLPRRGDWVAVGANLIAFGFAVALFAQVILGIHDPGFQRTWQIDYLRLGSFHIEMGIWFDNLTACMLVVVTLVSSMVNLFSVGYMAGDPRYSRYFAHLSLFTFSMLGLVLAHNLIGLYVFWELVGLTSYLLIGFWFEKHSAANAAKKAFLTTRVGDVGMFIGILIISWKLGDFTYAGVFEGIADGNLSGPLLTLAGIGLFMGAVGKSAQVPLHAWLPDAMEGPTPVSALIHAATMVAAGVYLVGRLYPVFDAQALWVIALVGSITAFLAATIAITATDIKKVLAYSTISQLGYMIAGLGAGAFAAGLFHLWTHAYFKALLFLGAGSVIHAVHSQEMFEMGGLRRKMPITFATMLVATLAISGVPGLSGFFSKDAILAGTLAFGMSSGGIHYLPFVLLLMAAAITAFYMFRLLFLTFTGEPRDHHKFDHAHESPAVMTIPLVVLATMSVVSVGIPFVTQHWFEGVVQLPAAAEHGPTVSHEMEHAAHLPALWGSLAAAGLGILLSYLTYVRGVISAAGTAARLRPLYLLLKNKYFFDELYGAVVVRGVLAFSFLARILDIYVIDAMVNGAGKLAARLAWFIGGVDLFGVDGLVNGLAQTVIGFGRAARKVQTGRLQNYVYGFMGILLIIVFVKMFR